MNNKYIKLTHKSSGGEMYIAKDKIISVQQRFDQYTGEVMSLITYGGNSGNYVNETIEEIMAELEEGNV